MFLYPDFSVIDSREALSPLCSLNRVFGCEAQLEEEGHKEFPALVVGQGVEEVLGSFRV